MKMLSDVAEFVVQWWPSRMGKFSNRRIGRSACKTRCLGRERMGKNLFCLLFAMTVSVAKA